MRAVTCFGRWLGLAALGLAAAEVEWTDTPVLTSIWQATSSGETDRLIDMFVGTKDSGVAVASVASMSRLVGSSSIRMRPCSRLRVQSPASGLGGFAHGWGAA